jgi:hypothetical protein
MPEITLEEAKKLYNSSDEAKAFLLSKFSKEELESKLLPYEVIITSTPRGLNEFYLKCKRSVDESITIQEDFYKFFEENIFSLIDPFKTKFLDRYGKVSKTPTSRIELRNSNNEWLFNYNYDQKNQYFYYSYHRVYTIFQKQFSLQKVDITRLMKSLVDKHFNIHIGTIMRFQQKILSLVEKHCMVQ